MLTVKYVGKVALSALKIDEYVPLSVKYGTWNISEEPTLYWRIGNFSSSLLEIGLGSKSGNIRSITLILFSFYEVYTPVQHNYFINILEGIPCVLVDDLFLESINLDERIDFKVFLSSNSVKIVFLDNEVKYIVKNERTLFGIDENENICFFEICDISYSEMNLFIECYHD